MAINFFLLSTRIAIIINRVFKKMWVRGQSPGVSQSEVLCALPKFVTNGEGLNCPQAKMATNV